MSKNYDLHDDSGAPLLTSQGDLLRQYVVIGSGRLPNICPGIESRAAEIAEEVLDLARTNGHPGYSAPTCTAQAAYAFFDWLDAACAAAGFEVVDEIFNRPKHRSLQ